jgi:hypothetical protein
VSRKFLSSLAVDLSLTVGVIWLSHNLIYSQTVNQTGKCDPAYPDVCIQSPPPDLNCTDVPDKGFKVLPPDPHGFDHNGNGSGCEEEP